MTQTFRSAQFQAIHRGSDGASRTVTAAQGELDGDITICVEDVNEFGVAAVPRIHTAVDSSVAKAYRQKNGHDALQTIAHYLSRVGSDSGESIARLQWLTVESLERLARAAC